MSSPRRPNVAFAPADDRGSNAGGADARGFPDTGDTTYPPEWELFDPGKDPDELTRVQLDPAYAGNRSEPIPTPWDLPQELGDPPHPRQPVPEGRTR
ncbi:hypothetical protein [Microbacterium sp. 22242]|uniref:hypothetical protein n=1 Tax=Microbacterium sp. 22242 TaxID=3453896 RepID=UPI003F84885F